MLGETSELSAGGIKALNDFARQLANGNQPQLSLLEAELPAGLTSGATDVSELTLETDSEVEARLQDTPDDTAQAEEAQAPEPAPEPEDQLPVAQMDSTLLQLMIAEVQQNLTELEVLVSGLSAGSSQEVSKDLVRAIHTLAGTFAMAPLGQEAQVARGLENYLEDRLTNDTAVSTAATIALQTCLHRFHQRLAILDGGNETSYPVKDKQLLADLAGLAGHETTVAEADQLAATEEFVEEAAQLAATEEPVAPAEEDEGLQRFWGAATRCLTPGATNCQIRNWSRTCNVKFIPSRVGHGWPALKLWAIWAMRWKPCLNASRPTGCRRRSPLFRRSKKVVTG